LLSIISNNTPAGLKSVTYSRRLSSAKLKTTLSFLSWRPKKLAITPTTLIDSNRLNRGVRDGLFLNRNGFGRSRFNLTRFSRSLKLQSVSLKRQPAIAARIGRLIRAMRATPFMRRQWWRFAKYLSRRSIRRPVIRVFRSHLAWRFPFYRYKVQISTRRRKLEKLIQARRGYRRYSFTPRPLIRRIRHLFFMNQGFWRKSEDIFRLRVRFTLNNMFASLSSVSNKNLINVSSGVLGFKGTTKLTTYAVERMAVYVSKFMRRRHYKNLYLIFNSGAIGYKSKLFVETLIRNALVIKYLTVSDAVPHNGVRPRKSKRR
jgi:ribosomal protein S11